MLISEPDLGETWGGGQYWKADLSKETFVHFTLPDRAVEILKAGKLLIKPPYQKFGPDKVYAVSATWGTFVPSVQTTHYQAKDLVAVVFKTNVPPQIAFTEEVVWNRDVPLSQAKILPYSTAVALIKRASQHIGEQDEVRYASRRTAKAQTVFVQPPKAVRDPYPFTGYIDFQGLEIDVENRKGEVRSGVDGDGHKWSITMSAHYGEIRNTEGTDGDKLDVYVGENPNSDVVVIVRQSVPDTGAYDEDKVMIGFDSPEEALAVYKQQYDKPGFYGGHKVRTMADLKRWVEDKRNFGQRVYSKKRQMVQRIASQYLRNHALDS